MGAAAVTAGPAPDAVARLRRLDSCAVSDACDRLGLPDRVVTGLAPLTGPARRAGRVVTVELGPWTGGGGASHLCTAATDASTADDVIVVAHHGRTDCAGWGGNLSRAARARGAAATIVDGAARDIDESRTVGHPVFALAATPRTARGRTEEVAWGGPVTIGRVAVNHGDYVVADSTGVVFVPADRIDEVLVEAEAIAAKEAAMAAALDDGQPVSVVMGRGYEAMLHRPDHDT
ncbi:MAG: RraA family protein [Acidimicrobiia bacterium]|nr:RraA family protein [Acidimicrobiia bacterium]